MTRKIKLDHYDVALAVVIAAFTVVALSLMLT
jgi:hypothetical protein